MTTYNIYTRKGETISIEAVDSNKAFEIAKQTPGALFFSTKSYDFVNGKWALPPKRRGRRSN